MNFSSYSKTHVDDVGLTMLISHSALLGFAESLACSNIYPYTTKALAITKGLQSSRGINLAMTKNSCMVMVNLMSTCLLHQHLIRTLNMTGHTFHFPCHSFHTKQ